MTSSLSEKDYKEGLIVSCFDLFESYGNDLYNEIDDLIEKPHFSIVPNWPIENSEEETKEEEELRAEKERKKHEKLKNILENGREKKSYISLKSLETIDSNKLKLREKLIDSRSWPNGYSLLDKILKIVRGYFRKKQPNAGVFLDIKNPILLAPTFNEMLVDFMQKKCLDSKDVYEAANIDRRLFSKILSDTYYQPSKETAIYLCLALKLNIEEAEDFLATAGYALSRSKIYDVVVEYFIRTANYNIQDLHEIIYEIQSLAEQEFDN